MLKIKSSIKKRVSVKRIVVMSLMLVPLIGALIFSAAITHAQQWDPLQFRPGDYFKYQVILETPEHMDVDPKVELHYTISESSENPGEWEFLWNADVEMGPFFQTSVSRSVVALPEKFLDSIHKEHEKMYETAESELEEMALGYLPLPAIHIMHLAGEELSVEDISIDEQIYELEDKSITSYRLSSEYIKQFDELSEEIQRDYISHGRVWINPDLPLPVKIIYPEGDTPATIKLVEYERNDP